MRGTVVIALLSAVALGGCNGRDRTSASGDGSAGSDASIAGDGASGSTLFDCTSRPNFDDPRCQRSAGMAPGSVGTGPAFLQEPQGGFVDGSELVLAFHRDIDAGFLMSVDLTDGTRTLRSGTYDNPALGVETVGEGPDMVLPSDVERGPDGWYVLAEGGLFRVDPETGDRELARPFAECSLGGEITQMVLHGFAMDDAGLAYVAAMSGLAGAGIVALAADGSCETVTWSPAPGYEGRGSGPEAQNAMFAGLALHDGYLWATYLNTEMLYRIDLSTGDRVGVSSSYDAAPVGGGDEMLVGGFLHFPSADRVYSTGLGRGSIHLTEIDLETGFRTARPAEFGSLRDAWSERPLVAPYLEGGAVVIGAEDAVHVLEPARGNSFILSY